MTALIVAPHSDDEVYGCTSFLTDPNLDKTVLYITAKHPDVPSDQLMAERLRVGDLTGASQIVWDFPTNGLSEVPQAKLIHAIESELEVTRPEFLLLPAPSYNQDHRAVTDAALTAARPHDLNWFVPKILLYEQPETFGTLRKPDPFRPTYFRALDINQKAALYEAYSTQIRGHRSFNHICTIAELRGMQSNQRYAEAFEVLRWVE